MTIQTIITSIWRLECCQSGKTTCNVMPVMCSLFGSYYFQTILTIPWLIFCPNIFHCLSTWVKLFTILLSASSTLIKPSFVRPTHGLLPGLINLHKSWAPLEGTKFHTSNICWHYSSKSATGHLLHSIFSAGTFVSDLHSQAQRIFKEAWFLPCGFYCRYLCGILPSPILIPCPYHLSLPSSTTSNNLLTPRSALIPSFLNLSILFPPFITLRAFI